MNVPINSSCVLYRFFAGFTLLIMMILGPTAYAQPTFDKSFSPATIGPGSVSTLQFNITNISSAGIRGLAFTDTLPAGMTIASPANATSTCNGGTLSAPDGGTSISYSGGGVGAASTCSITVNVTSSTPGTHTNTSGDLTSDAGNSGNATADLTVATDRPGFSKSFSPSTIAFGGRSTLTFIIDNTANPALAANLTFVDNLPSGMVVADPTNASKTCAGGTLTAVAGGSVISYSPAFFGDATVAAGASCTISVDVIGNTVGQLANITGELSSTPQFGGATRSSGKASGTLEVIVERISFSKSFNDDPIPPGGGMVNLEFTIRNLDRSATAGNIAFTDDLDAVLSGLVAVGLPANDICGTGSTLSGASTLSVSGGSLAAGASCTFSVDLQVPAGAVAGSYTNTTSSITADLDGAAVTGLPATDVLFIAPIPRLSKVFVDAVVGTGNTVIMRFTIENTSTTLAATDIAFTDNLNQPTFISGIAVSALPAAGFCGAGSLATTFMSSGDLILSVTGANLAAGASCSFDVELTVPADIVSSIYLNTTGQITATVDGAELIGNPASASLEVVSAPALTKEFIDDPVDPGENVTLEFTLAHDLNASADATGITFTDDLDAALSGLVATGLPQLDVCGSGSQIDGVALLTFSGGALSPGDSCTLSVTLQTPATAPAGAHTNTTSSVVATVSGVSAMANPAMDDLQIAGLTLTKEFTDDPVIPGDAVTLRFTIDNTSLVSTATNILFTDDLDATLNDLAGDGVPVSDVCGVGNGSISWLSGGRFLIFSGGSLAPGETCSFDVILQVPAGAFSDTYPNITSGFSATIDGTPNVAFENASDFLVVSSDLLLLSKTFSDDLVAPGGNVALSFTITNLSATDAVTDIAFTDDLDAALTGLSASSLPANDVCGTGSQLTGTDMLSLTGGNLAADDSCTFDVVLTVPSAAEPGTLASNVTSEVSGTSNGLAVSGDPARAEFQVAFLDFSKQFDGDVDAGATAVLTFTIQNLSASESVAGLSFLDDLEAMLSGVVATGLPAFDICGTGSQIDGSSLLAFTGGNLLPNGSCSFNVTLQVPAGAAPGTYLNATSSLRINGSPVADGAQALLTVLSADDSDGDGVLDVNDVCPATVIPEGVPTQSLGNNRYALIDDDGIFDTISRGDSSGTVFTIQDTAGCSCEQIIEELGLGKGHEKKGCSGEAMQNWVDLVNP